MNKQEFKSAYNRITLSEEFKAQARAKLTEQFGSMQEHISGDDFTEEHPAASITIEPKRRSPWKAVAGIISAAAVVGIGIWGGSVLLSNEDNPLELPQDTQEVATSEAVTTAEATAEQNDTSEPETVEEAATELIQNTVILPTFSSDVWRDYTNGVNCEDMQPVELSISLPEGWSVEVDKSEDVLCYPVNITENGEVIATVNYSTYDRYSKEDALAYGIPQFGEPNYYQYVFSPIMLSSRINWGGKYTPVKESGWFCSATCMVEVNQSELGYNDNIVQYSGILAYNDDMGVSLNILFNRQLDAALHTDIADHIGIASSNKGLAERIAQLYVRNTLENREFENPVKFEAHSVDFNIGQCIMLDTGWNDGTETVQLYIVEDGRIYYGGILSSEKRIDAVDCNQGRTAFMLRICHLSDGIYEAQENVYYHNGDEMVKESLRYKLVVEGAKWYDIARFTADGWEDITEEEYHEILDAIDGEMYNYGGYDFDCRNSIDTTGESSDIAARIAPIVEDVLNGTYVRPDKPEPYPPTLWLNHDDNTMVKDGSEKPFLSGSYLWDGYTCEFRIADNAQKLESFGRYPSTYFVRGAILPPESGGKITSVTISTGDENRVPLEFTQEGMVTLPDEYVPDVTYYVIATVEYSAGSCEYIFPIYFPQSVNPPDLTIVAGGESYQLLLGSAYWHGALSGNPIGEEEACRRFLNGELTIVSGYVEAKVNLPENVRMLEATYYENAEAFGTILTSTQDGAVTLPMNCSGVVRLSMEFPYGSVSYWLGFDNAAEQIPESLTLSLGSREFEIFSTGETAADEQNHTTYLESDPDPITGLYPETASVQLPEGAKLVYASAQDIENFMQELEITSDGTIYLPYYQHFNIFLAVNFPNGEQGLYMFRYRSRGVPPVSITAGEHTVIPACEEWAYQDEIHVLMPTEDDMNMDYSDAFPLLGNNGLPRLPDNAKEIRISIPRSFSSISYIEAYDVNGGSYGYSGSVIGEDGVFEIPEEVANLNAAVFKVKVVCYGGYAVYWFGKYNEDFNHIRQDVMGMAHITFNEFFGYNRYGITAQLLTPQQISELGFDPEQKYLRVEAPYSTLEELNAELEKYFSKKVIYWFNEYSPTCYFEKGGVLYARYTEGERAEDVRLKAISVTRDNERQYTFVLQDISGGSEPFELVLRKSDHDWVVDSTEGWEQLYSSISIDYNAVLS